MRRLDQLAEVAAAQELHREIRRVAREPEVENAHDVAVVDLGDRQRLAQEALADHVAELESRRSARTTLRATVRRSFVSTAR